MQAMENSRTRKLLLCGVPVVVGHCFVVVWHLFLLVTLEPKTPPFLPPLLIVINVIPVVGLFVFTRGLSRLAAAMITIPLAVALIIGGYQHFVSPGSDNVFRMPPGPFILPYQISAVLLVILEALGCWIGIRMLLNKNPL